jgi:hypothetical protein
MMEDLSGYILAASCEGCNICLIAPIKLKEIFVTIVKTDMRLTSGS